MDSADLLIIPYFERRAGKTQFISSVSVWGVFLCYLPLEVSFRRKLAYNVVTGNA